MSIDLKRVQVKRLFDAYDLDVPIQDNTLILVGENGSGKSTLINLIYYTLTAQWDRLKELPFESCIITIGDEDYPIHRKILKESQHNFFAIRHFKSKLGEDELNNLLDQLAKCSPEHWSSQEGIEDLKEIQLKLSAETSFQNLKELAQLNPNFKSTDQHEKTYTDRLATVVLSDDKEQFLFLPTYRRIEKGLRDIFPNRDWEKNLSSSQKPSLFYRQPAYIELVEFGMEDVIRSFDSTLSDLDQNFRNELNRLTGSYLGDIIRNNYKNVDASQLATEEFYQTIDLMLPRIGNILSEDDRHKLKNLLEDVKSHKNLSEEQRVPAYFLTRLVEIHKRQQEKESSIRKLVDLVNKYLSNKELEFNPTEFKLMVARKNTEKNEVPLPGLSSGEKQIISLFSHIFLSDYEKYFIVIDEPELSISVPWQRRFLQDLKDTGKCSGLIAVTHSPFVFENSLSEYAHSISEFIRES